MSGLPHAVVKQTENSHVREHVNKIENHPHRQTLQARAMQTCSSYAKQHQKCNVQNAFFIGIKSDLLHLWTSLERKRIQPTFSPRCFLLPEQRHQEGMTSWCSARQNSGTERAFRGPQCAEEMSQKRNLTEFTIASNEIQHIVIRNSKLAGLRRSASRWTTGKPL